MPQRISYVPFDSVSETMQAELRRCAEHGTPRPESSAVRAHSERSFWFFAESWQRIFREGVVDHALKELCRVYISRTVTCEFCGNQRSENAVGAGGLQDMQYDELLNFEASDAYVPEQKAALRYAQAIAWGPSSVDEDLMWQEMGRYFTEEQMVELGCFIGLTFGQQSWIRLLGIDHHQYLAGSSGGMAPAFEDAAALAESKSSTDYWAAR
ncbi:MAG: carboxymuconolactone decarboxylase family protein [Candidatus Nanopelagicales bacterium]|jgi:alkylhydroperoxidase family enzyme